MINHNDTAARCAELVLRNSNARTLRDPNRLLRRIDATIRNYCDDPATTELDIALIRSITITSLALR
jgi:hypothetical protein